MKRYMKGQILLFLLCMFGDIKTKPPESWSLLSQAYISFCKSCINRTLVFWFSFNFYSLQKKRSQNKQQNQQQTQQNKQTNKIPKPSNSNKKPKQNPNKPKSKKT